MTSLILPSYACREITGTNIRAILIMILGKVKALLISRAGNGWAILDRGSLMGMDSLSII